MLIYVYRLQLRTATGFKFCLISSFIPTILLNADNNTTSQLDGHCSSLDSNLAPCYECCVYCTGHSLPDTIPVILSDNSFGTLNAHTRLVLSLVFIHPRNGHRVTDINRDWTIYICWHPSHGQSPLTLVPQISLYKGEQSLYKICQCYLLFRGP
jgi:hypothetical protein